MDLGKLTTGDRVIASSAVALFVFSFLPWFGFEKEFSRDGWHYPAFGILPLVLGLAMLAAVVAGVAATNLPRLPISWEQAELIAGCVAAILVVTKALTGDKVDVVFRTVDLEREFGLYLSLLAALGLALGGLIKTRESARTRR